MSVRLVSEVAIAPSITTSPWWVRVIPSDKLLQLWIAGNAEFECRTWSKASPSQAGFISHEFNGGRMIHVYIYILVKRPVQTHTDQNSRDISCLELINRCTFFAQVTQNLHQDCSYSCGLSQQLSHEIPLGLANARERRGCLGGGPFGNPSSAR